MNIADICKERMHEWTAQAMHVASTPICMVAVGHLEHCGEIHVFSPQGVPNEQIIGFLEFALTKLREAA